MIEVTVESIRVSLINQQRLVVLREDGTQRYLPIWIGPFEAEAITMGLQGTDAGRPLTHDLLRNVLDELGAQAQHIHINALQDDTFFARVVLSMNGDSVEIDSRPSDAIALAVRLDVPIFVADDVMDQAGQLPATEIDDEDVSEAVGGRGDHLEVFRDFVEGLDLDDIAGEE
jgi:bifunctional DNase/RNase